MRRGEALGLVAASLVALTGGLTWLFGPLGLIAVSVMVLLVVLFVVDVKEG